MPGLFRVKELEARKRALAVESEVYRQTLQQELRNLGDYAVHARTRFSLVRAFNPLLILGMPAAGYFLRQFFNRKTKAKAQKKSKFSRTLTTLIFGWRMYRKFAPVWRVLISQARKIRQRRYEENPRQWSESYNE